MINWIKKLFKKSAPATGSTTVTPVTESKKINFNGIDIDVVPGRIENGLTLDLGFRFTIEPLNQHNVKINIESMVVTGTNPTTSKYVREVSKENLTGTLEMFCYAVSQSLHSIVKEDPYNKTHLDENGEIIHEPDSDKTYMN